VKKTYQGTRDKSKQKFEVLGKRDRTVEVPLPMVEAWEELQAQVEELTGAWDRRTSPRRSRARCAGAISQVT